MNPKKWEEKKSEEKTEVNWKKSRENKRIEKKKKGERMSGRIGGSNNIRRTRFLVGTGKKQSWYEEGPGSQRVRRGRRPERVVQLCAAGVHWWPPPLVGRHRGDVVQRVNTRARTRQSALNHPPVVDVYEAASVKAEGRGTGSLDRGFKHQTCLELPASQSN